LLQLVEKLSASLLRTHLVDKLWDFYVCRRWHQIISMLVRSEYQTIIILFV
jgi:hypothetical protein